MGGKGKDWHGKRIREDSRAKNSVIIAREKNKPSHHTGNILPKTIPGGKGLPPGRGGRGRKVSPV